MKIETPACEGATIEFINSFYERQFEEWPEVKENYDRLGEVRRTPLTLGDWHGALQCNPARIVSTGAKIDKESISKRKCFLCTGNRPPQQLSASLFKDWDFLVNPYPIFPVHFTIVSKKHTPQIHVPLDIAAMAEKLPGLAFFFNGARAGASAPDHLHMQAVLKCELPLIKLIEENHPADRKGFITSEEYGLELPFQFVSAAVSPDNIGMETLLRFSGAFGIDTITGESDCGLVNSFAWIDESGLLRLAIVPRRSHRPRCYGTGSGEFLVSPGAIDMAGIIIIPRKEDFNKLSAEDISNIYADVSFEKNLPVSIIDYFTS